MNLPKLDENQFWIVFWFMVFTTFAFVILVIGVSSILEPSPLPEYEELKLKLGYCAALDDQEELECYKLVMSNVQHP